MKSIRPIILGCSKNRVDMEHILSCLDGHYEIVPEEEERDYVDIVLIDTCSFIGDAKEESIRVIFEAVQDKKRGAVGEIVVFGCLPQRYSAEMPELIPEVDAWFGARNFTPLLEHFGVRSAPGRLLTTPGHYAFLKISEGCDRRCSYCAIPFIRGNHRSVPIGTLVEEARALAAGGVKELIIIAQDTTYYGLDIYGHRALAELLKALSQVEGIEWMRMHYSYPTDFPQDVLDEMNSNPKICKYMDIPLQHISDKVLGMMHRGIDSAGTRELVRAMREKVPGIVLRTTMIVGHPGEGEEEFAELLDFVREARFERLGAFEYSEEEGTFDALHFRDEVPAKMKARRLKALMKEQKKISLGFNLSRVGSETRVIVDDFTDGVLVCRSQFESPEVDGEILVGYGPEVADGVGPHSLVGNFINVRITGADEYDLIAEIVK
ncbi:MAG: 30S ribosomal protein S12 methylthiotransferase RimO [Bacteroidales bacterium]|nr:30S ribosomal protein S12 methylthiotransferase RimO [Bacteroidales bacterium]